MYKKYTRKQELVIITFILLLALVSTYFIYNKFSDERKKVDYNSENVDVVFNDKTGDKITIKKVTPLNDNVGLSTKAYNFEINNNLTEKVYVKIQLIDDTKEINKDNCEDKLIPKDNIKVTIKKNSNESEIYRLSELDDGVLLEDTINPIAHNTYAVRAWVDKDAALTPGSSMHYHGIIKITEEDSLVG